MPDILKIRKKNEVFIHIECEPSIANELSDFFTFFVPGYKFMPSYKNKFWDGKIRLFDSRLKTIYGGLLPYIKEFAETRKCEIEYVNDPYYGLPHTQELIDPNELAEFIASLNLYAHGKSIEPREYQVEAVTHALCHWKSLLLSPTASGKSLIIYILIRWYLARYNKKVLLIVPTTSLCRQMEGDFKDYATLDDSWNAKDNIGVIMGGLDKDPKLTKIEVTLENNEIRCFYLDEMVQTQRGKISASLLTFKDELV